MIPERTVFVSGCYDILHAGHIQFFTEARALGSKLVVSFASAEVLWHYKQRRTSIPDEHKRAVLESLVMVDEVVVGCDLEDPALDFASEFRRVKPQLLVVTEDDQFAAAKQRLCAEVGAEYRVLPKSPPRFAPVSTSSIVRWIQAPTEAPLRVDFAGGWLDVPRFSRPGAKVVNCAISPLVSLRRWDYEKQAGLGGSGAWALLNGVDGVNSELDLGVGWQDPAVIRETGLCVWASGEKPRLLRKSNADFLSGCLALRWTGKSHDTPSLVDLPRNYELIEQAGEWAARAVQIESLEDLAEAVKLSYHVQLEEGMEALPEDSALARKYLGGGWGGYAVLLFSDSEVRERALTNDTRLRAIEPYNRI